MFGSIFDSITETVSDFVESPVESVVRMALQPVVDGCDLLQGLTEGEFRHKAVLRLGADVVAGMAISEIIDAMAD